jgi:hypothetical protein
MKKDSEKFQIENIYLAKAKKEGAVCYFCTKNEENTHVFFLRDLENPVKIDDIAFGNPPKIEKDPFFITIMEKYGARTLSLEQLLAIERTYINIQKIRNTQKRLFEGMER